MSDQTTQTQTTEEKTTKKRTFVEEIEVSGNKLVDQIKELVQQSNTRRVVIRQQNGDEIMTIPLTLGVLAGGIITLSAPLLAALGALAALVTRVKLEVVREEEDKPEAGSDLSEGG